MSERIGELIFAVIEFPFKILIAVSERYENRGTKRAMKAYGISEEMAKLVAYGSPDQIAGRLKYCDAETQKQTIYVLGFMILDRRKLPEIRKIVLVLEEMLAHDDPEVRKSAEWALAKAGKHVIPFLLERSLDKDPKVRISALKTVVKTDPTALSLKQIRECLMDLKPERKAAAGYLEIVGIIGKSRPRMDILSEGTIKPPKSRIFRQPLRRRAVV